MDITLLNSLGLILVALVSRLLAQRAQWVQAAVPARCMQHSRQDR